MKQLSLADAIRLGAMLRPQGFNAYFDGTGTCAIGAASEANGIDVTEGDSLIGAFERQYLAIFRQPCPACGLRPDTLFERVSGFHNTVVHMNDDHRWTREAIADWVESIEREHEQPSSQPQPDPVLVEQAG